MSLCDIDWQLIANMATALALIVAVGVFIWQIVSRRQEKAYTKSQFGLQSALESYDLAIELLSDDNNDRVTWIAAARIVERANQISSNVTEQVHVDVLEVQRERYRRQMATILGYDDSSKSGSFFYGADSAITDIDAAAKAATQPVHLPRTSKGQLKYLAESSLATLYELASYPSNYADPLKVESLDPEMNIEMRSGFPGLYEYLSHRKKYESVQGSLVEREGNKHKN